MSTEDLPFAAPVADDVAALLRSRTKDGNGNELGTFTDATRPSLEAVEALIATAYGDVAAQTGANLSGRNAVAARSMIALRAAMLTELSYFPEQVRGDRSAYEQYARMYGEGMTALLEAVADAGEGAGAASSPMASVPIIGWTAAAALERVENE